MNVLDKLFDINWESAIRFDFKRSLIRFSALSLFSAVNYTTETPVGPTILSSFPFHFIVTPNSSSDNSSFSVSSSDSPFGFNFLASALAFWAND